MKSRDAMNSQTILHYRILHQLGAGGMGEVYLAEDTKLDRKVAIKFLPPESTADEHAKKRLVREAQAAAKLDHPNICSIYEIGEADGRSFIVMQYVEGETLANLIQRKPLDLRESLDIAVQIAGALAEAHSRGIVHRDIKPQNVMITARGQVKVLDFGLAKIVQQRSMVESKAETQSLLTEPGLIIGTVPYMSPEQIRGEVLDARTDIFSFGAVMYEVVTGRQPFSAESAAATILAILAKEPPALSRYVNNVPEELKRIVRKCLEKDRGRRYPAARDLAIDLENCSREFETAQITTLLESKPSGDESVASGASRLTGIPQQGLVIGQRIGHYQVRAKLGAGGMGEVYRAHDEQLDRDVALKVLPARSFSDATARARLLREAKSAAALNHPNICTIHEVGEAEGQAYIAMEVVEGQPLSARLAAGPLQPELILRYGMQMAEALAHAHDRGIVHRDLKGANVVITREGRAKVLDFGLARRLSEDEMDEVTRSHASLTAPGALVGTLAYMAPEQLRGQPADARSDVWALGVVLYEMAAGTRPFQGHTGFELSAAILSQRPAPLPAKAPVGLQAVIERCIAKEPSQRYQRAGEVRAALEATQSGAASPWTAARYALARRRWLTLAAALVVVLSGVFGLDVGGVRSRLLRGSAVSLVESLAVLPVVNLTGDPAQEYFADGMTEELITEFSRVRAFKRVIPRTSVMGYKGVNRPLREIAGELGVDAVVEASLLQTRGQVRATVRLIDGTTEQNLWADRYARNLSEAPTIYTQVVGAVAKQLALTLTADEQTRLASVRPVNPEAYDAYLKGRFYSSKLSLEGYETALEYFRLALHKDANFALAHGGIGQIALSRGHMGFAPPSEVTPQAKQAVLKALTLDDTQPDLHDFMAGVHMYLEWDWPGAEREFRRLQELKPQNWGCTAALYVDYLLLMGRREEALADMRRCLEANPLNSYVDVAFGGRMLRLGRYEEGIALLQKAAKAEPNMGLAHRYLWTAFHQKGMHEQAVAEAKLFWRLTGHDHVASLIQRGYAEGGYPKGMKLAADTLAGRFTRTYVQPSEIARLYLYAGEKERALEWLEKAYEARDTWLVFLKDDPRFEGLHSEPRFQSLLRRLSLLT
ncbi:MAG: protein kinase [Acidobacteriota bacterium]